MGAVFAASSPSGAAQVERTSLILVTSEAGDKLTEKENVAFQKGRAGGDGDRGSSPIG